MPSLSSFIKLVKLFWNNADQIARLLDVLTSKLPDAGTALVNAGNFTLAMAQTLQGGGPTPYSARQSVADAATALGDGAQKVHTIASDINSVQIFLDQIITVITGITELYPFSIADPAVREAHTMLTDLEGQFGKAHTNLQGLSTQLGQMGMDMTDAGNALVTVGQIFQQMH